jgi:RND family efflux transporter MFP subunit
MNSIIKTLFPILLTIILASCNNVADNNAVDKSSVIADSTNEVAKVKTIVLKTGNFDKEAISNGKLRALQVADLFFRSRDIQVSTINVKNGDRVKKGQLLASLDNFTLQNNYSLLQIAFERSKLDLQDVLIGQGYNANDTSNIPPKVYKTACIKSGFDRALAELKKSEYELQMAELRAPFNGIIANLFCKENNLPPAEKFCSVINDENFEAEFPLLENELQWVSQGQKVTILPYPIPNLKVEGRVSQINPVIDQNGMIKVRALCQNPGQKLFDGMNVKIIVADKEPNKLSIPKEALVFRNEKQVVFTYSNGLAKWNYVKTGLENSTRYTIEEGLEQGDSVIIEGAMNLAHDAKVELRRE